MKRSVAYLLMLVAAGCYATQQSACDIFAPSPAPVPSPSASPSPGSPPSPSPSTSPSPSPSPTIAPTPTVTCGLPEKPDCGNSGCCTEGGVPLFNEQISVAQAALRNAKPELFNSDGSIKVAELIYVDFLAKTLMTINPGMCARAGSRLGDSISKDEVAIKVNNGQSQNVDVIIGGSNQPYIGGRYTCSPANF